MKNTVVIGGGIIGLCTAYYLHKSGHRVRVIDAGDMTGGASFVNAGYVAPSHFVPLAAPGMVSKGLGYMLDSSSPFYMKPRFESDFIKWSYAFFKSCTSKNVAKASKPIFEINMLSRELYQDLLNDEDWDSQFDERGLMMYFQTEKNGYHEIDLAHRARKEFGVQTEVLEPHEIKERFEPDMDLDIKGGVWYPCDRQMTPGDFMKTMIKYLEKQGVELYRNQQVQDFVIKEDQVKEIKTKTGVFSCDQTVICAGTWSPQLAKNLGRTLLVEAGKGYRLDVKVPTGIRQPAILVERNMAISPMEGYTRFAGTMELAGINDKINPSRVKALKEGAEAFYTNLNISQKVLEEAHYGLRPVSPDGLPMIGQDDRISNVYWGTGHAMMGWSLGPATGKILQELIDGESIGMDLEVFHPNRTF